MRISSPDKKLFRRRPGVWQGNAAGREKGRSGGVQRLWTQVLRSARRPRPPGSRVCPRFMPHSAKSPFPSRARPVSLGARRLHAGQTGAAPAQEKEKPPLDGTGTGSRTARACSVKGETCGGFPKIRRASASPFFRRNLLLRAQPIFCTRRSTSLGLTSSSVTTFARWPTRA